MTLPQMKLWLREGERSRRRERASFIHDVATAVSGMMSDGDHVQKAIDRLLEE